MKPKKFALIGAAGFVTPRHLKAIHDTGNDLIAAVDPNDSVGVLDHYFPQARFFTEIERFDRFLEKRRRESDEAKIDYISVCTPNYLHDAHVRLALRVRAHAICEKPLVLSPWNIDALSELEQEYNSRIFPILQLRLLRDLINLRQELRNQNPRRKADICLSYMSQRGPWYHTSWKGDPLKSGTVAMNIGIHFFDLLLWLFGDCNHFELHLHQQDKMAGILDLEWARVTWFLSVDGKDLPEGYLDQGKTAYRSLTMDGKEIEFSTGFADLHTDVYRQILAGKGFTIQDARPAIALVHKIRFAELTIPKGARHPQLGK